MNLDGFKIDSGDFRLCVCVCACVSVSMSVGVGQGKEVRASGHSINSLLSFQR